MSTDSTSAKRPTTSEEIHAGLLRRRIEGVAEKLHRLAEYTDRLAQRVDQVGRPGIATYGTVAAAVQHEVATTLANLHLEGLTTDASDADITRAKAQTAERIAAKIESTVGQYPHNGAERPKLAAGEHANDATWAAMLAYRWIEDEEQAGG